MKKILIIGPPNVGKSSLYNRIIGRRKAIVSDISGTTRDINYINTSVNNVQFSIGDSGGYIDEELIFQSEINYKILSSINDADLIWFVIDKNYTIDNYNLHDITKFLIKRKENVILVINKVDQDHLKFNYSDYYKLGFKYIMPISAVHSINVSNLIENSFKILDLKATSKEKEDNFKVSIIGKPNAGKSTLFNRIIDQNLSIISSKKNTTVDPVSSLIEHKDIKFSFTDTAGVNKNSITSNDDLLFYSKNRTVKKVKESNIVVLIIPADEGITARDQKIGSIALKFFKPLLIVINKSDLVSKKEIDELNLDIKSKFNHVKQKVVTFCSLIKQKDLSKIWKSLLLIKEDYNQEIDVASLKNYFNRFEIINKIYHSSNSEIKKIEYNNSKNIKFTFHISGKRKIHFSTINNLENKIRDVYNYRSIPIEIVIKYK